jgi:SpoVK/Ycf46/Vps4 family AAA+-type ATPase
LSSTDIARAEVGSGEKMVAMAFETAKMNSPSVVFIDEFQALFTERSSSGGSTRLTSTLLVCMDDLKRWRDIDQSEHESTDEKSDDHHIVVLAATNTPWMVDQSFLRPGRFDRAVHVGLPNFEERCAILKLHSSRMQIRTDDLSAMCHRLAVSTEGCSGADIAALSRGAAVRCLVAKENCVEERHFSEVLEDDFCPSSDEGLVERNAKWRSC